MIAGGDIRPDARLTVWPVALVWLLTSIIYLFFRWDRIIALDLLDPDDALRLVQVRDLLGGQGWFDLHQYRITPPEGVVMHWSRIVDLPLAASLYLLEPLLGQGLAERLVTSAVPLLLLGALMYVLARMTHRLAGQEAAVFACVVAALLPIINSQFAPLRIDHHGWQVLAFTAAVWGLFWRNPVAGAALTGVSLAVGLMVSLELLPMAAAIGLVMLARRIDGSGEHQASFAVFLQALAGSLIVLFLLTRGFDFANYCDAISPAHLSLFAVIAAGATFMSRATRLSPLLTLGVLGLSGLLGVASFALMTPACLASPFASLDPLVHSFWYQNVLEGQPLWSHPSTAAALFLPQLAVALVAAIMLVRRNTGERRRQWLEYTFVLSVAFVAALFTTRSMAFASALGAVAVGWLLTRIMDRLTRSRGLPLKLANAASVTAIALLPFVSFFVHEGAKAMITDTTAAETDEHGGEGCAKPIMAAFMVQLPPGLVLTQIDLGPHLLATTRHKVVGTAHHRGEKGLLNLITFFTAEAAEARGVVADLQVDYVLTCAPMPEMQLYLDRSGKDAMSQRLERGKAPSWLRPVALTDAGDFKLWKVRPDQPAAAALRVKPPESLAPRR